jgi:zinc protease
MFSPLRHVTFHRLPNGLRVLLKEEHDWPLVSVQAWVGVGSVDETESEAGLAHVLEHMVFKGTTRHAAADISRWIEVHGGALNAETSKEYTHYYMDLPAAGARQAVHLAAELLCRATIAPQEWARERPVILEEMKRRNDDAETMAWELFQKAIYSDAAHSRAVIGSPETVSSCSADTVRRFYKAHYTAAHTLVVMVGDFKTRDALRWLGREFRSMPKGAAREPRPESIVHRGAAHQHLKKPVQQAYAIYGFPTPPAAHPDQEALDLLAVLLGDGRNARLVHTLREDKKLVWSVGASNITQEGPGIFAVFTECDAKNRLRVGPAVQSILHGLKRSPPTSEEIRRAKNLIQTSWLQGYETFHNQASTIGAYALDHHLERLQRYLPKILSLNSRDLKRVIGAYFSQDLCSAVVEP